MWPSRTGWQTGLSMLGLSSKMKSARIEFCNHYDCTMKAHLELAKRAYEIGHEQVLPVQ